MAGRRCLKATSTVQSTIALSSGESEYYAIVKASSQGLGLRAFYQEWGLAMKVIVRSDSSAARRMTQRRGLGKVRHIQTRYLCVQQQVHQKEIALECVATAKNVSDLCTKPVSQQLCEKHMSAIGQTFQSGKSTAAKSAM